MDSFPVRPGAQKLLLTQTEMCCVSRSLLIRVNSFFLNRFFLSYIGYMASMEGILRLMDLKGCMGFRCLF